MTRLRLSARILLVTTGLLVTMGPAGANIAYTTDPDPDGFHTKTGVNNLGETATWEAGGHLTYTKTLMQGGPYPPNTYQYNFAQHDDTVCGYSFCDTFTPKAYMKARVLSGAGELGDTENVAFWVQQKLFVNWVENGQNDVIRWRIYFDLDYREREWGPINVVTDKVVQYKVGTWQGLETEWLATAATPNTGLP